MECNHDSELSESWPQSDRPRLPAKTRPAQPASSERAIARAASGGRERGEGASCGVAIFRADVSRQRSPPSWPKNSDKRRRRAKCRFGPGAARGLIWKTAGPAAAPRPDSPRIGPPKSRGRDCVGRGPRADRPPAGCAPTRAAPAVAAPKRLTSAVDGPTIRRRGRKKNFPAESSAEPPGIEAANPPQGGVLQPRPLRPSGRSRRVASAECSAPLRQC